MFLQSIDSRLPYGIKSDQKGWERYFTSLQRNQGTMEHHALKIMPKLKNIVPFSGVVRKGRKLVAHAYHLLAFDTICQDEYPPFICTFITEQNVISVGAFLYRKIN